MKRLLGIFALALIFSSSAAAWDTKELGAESKGSKQKWQSVYLCLEDESSDECQANEHERVSNAALEMASKNSPWLIGNRTDFRTYDLNAELFQPDIKGIGALKYITMGDDEEQIEGRLLPPVPHFAGLPDISYTVYDWANKNQLCPALPENHPDEANCHVFSGWHGARLNATHFGSQASRSYKRLHAIALSQASKAAELHKAASDAGDASLKAHSDAIREAEYLALIYEAAGQHFLSDRWATGHMFERWGPPEWRPDYNDPTELKIAGMITGILHGYESTSHMASDAIKSGETWLESAAQETFGDRVAAYALPAKSELDYSIPDALSSPELNVGTGELEFARWRFRDSGNPKLTWPGMGDYRLADAKDKRFGKEYSWFEGRDRDVNVDGQFNFMMKCLAAGYGEVIRKFGKGKNGGYGIDNAVLEPAGNLPKQPEDCFTPYVTNKSMLKAWELGPALKTAPLVETMALMVSEDFAKETATPLRKDLAKITLQLQRRAADEPDGIDVADGGLIRLLGVPTGKQFSIAGYFEPVDLDGEHLPNSAANGRSKETIKGLFNRAHAKYFCDDANAILDPLRHSTDPDKKSVCRILAQRTYAGTWEDYKGEQSEFPTLDFNIDKTPIESLCKISGSKLDYTKSDDMPTKLHPGYIPFKEAHSSTDMEPFSPYKIKSANQSIANWCDRVPVINLLAGRKTFDKDIVASFYDVDDTVILTGWHFGDKKGEILLGQSRAEAVAAEDIKTWEDGRIEFAIGSQYDTFDFEEVESDDEDKERHIYVFIDTSDKRKSVGRFVLREKETELQLVSMLISKSGETKVRFSQNSGEEVISAENYAKYHPIGPGAYDLSLEFNQDMETENWPFTAQFNFISIDNGDWLDSRRWSGRFEYRGTEGTIADADVKQIMYAGKSARNEDVAKGLDSGGMLDMQRVQAFVSKSPLHVSEVTVTVNGDKIYQAKWEDLDKRERIFDRPKQNRSLFKAVNQESPKEGKVEVKLKLSAPIAQKNAPEISFPNFTTSTTGSDYDWSATFDLSALDLKDDDVTLPLKIKLTNSFEFLDPDPSTIPYMKPDSEQGQYWANLEGASGSGEDTSHSLSLTPHNFPEDLAGIWESDNYMCGFSGFHETFRIDVNGTYVTTTKIKGDQCVPSGHVSWKGDFNRQDFQIRGIYYGGYEDKPEIVTEAARLKVVNIDKIVSLQGSTDNRNHIFTRRKSQVTK